MFHDAFPIVYTRDVPRSLAFYRDALGFEPRYRWPPEGDPDFVQLALGPLALGLAAASAPADLLGQTMGDDPRFELCLYTDDVDTAVAELRSRGAELLREPEEMPWGERMAYVADPDGNPVQITARPHQG